MLIITSFCSFVVQFQKIIVPAIDILSNKLELYETNLRLSFKFLSTLRMFKTTSLQH